MAAHSSLCPIPIRRPYMSQEDVSIKSSFSTSISSIVCSTWWSISNAVADTFCANCSTVQDHRHYLHMVWVAVHFQSTESVSSVATHFNVAAVFISINCCVASPDKRKRNCCRNKTELHPLVCVLEPFRGMGHSMTEECTATKGIVSCQLMGFRI